jgi:hypothetical protein
MFTHYYIQSKCFGHSYDMCSVHFITISRELAGLGFLSYIFLHEISVIYVILGYAQFMVMEDFESSS